MSTGPGGEIIKELLGQLYTCDTSTECLKIAEDLAGNLKALGVTSLVAFGVLDNFRAGMKDKKSGLVREGALLGIWGIAKGMGRMAEPYLLDLLPEVLEGLADKGQPVREAAQLTLTAIMELFSEHSAKIVLPVLYEAMSKKWQIKIGALEQIEVLVSKSPVYIAFALPTVIKHVEECLHDTKPEVAKVATSCMKKLCAIAGNDDIEPHIPMLVECMVHPDAVPACVQKLGSTTFVQDMTGPALAVMIPLLVRALNERNAVILRPTSIIIDNLCKLVKNPAEAGQFLPQLLPGLERIVETAGNPEVRALAETAKQTMEKVGGTKQTSVHEEEEKEIDNLEKSIALILEKELSKEIFVNPFARTSVSYLSVILAQLAFNGTFKEQTWKDYTTAYLSSFLIPGTPLTPFYKPILDEQHEIHKKKFASLNEIDTDDGEELCNCEFSLAYGARMLLNRTRLRLVRGQRYGLCGHNGAGKSTLMRAISQGKVEGFPSAEELKTVFVEHSLQGEDAELSVVDFVAKDPNLAHVARADIIAALAEVGFNDDRQAQAVGALSGGWKMKLELGRAMLMKADILLLDEPTNHLDVENIKWLEDYLNSQKNVTSIIVSHDSSFLDNVCTYIIHYESKKLVYYKGNLSKFVEKKPEAKSYYTLAVTKVKFSFPPPSILLGIRSNTKAILKMSDCTFTYPGCSKPSISNVSVQLSLSSRVAVVGPNGAGKSTLIKLLTGETQPQSGTVWKHPNLRVGYVAQHAFHHLNQHLEKTPNQYLQWRYQYGQDKELLEKVTRKLTDEDKAQMEVPITGSNGQKRKVEFICGRAKLKKSFQYEIKFVGLDHRFNAWIPRERLIELGFSKIVQAFDDQEASREGQNYRELVPSVIQKHFEELGLEADITNHSQISGLSGGQKVKVVLAGAMWNNPHLLVLDEPTNYLDREALGGLAVAIRDWAGAVIMISHNTEFIGALCPETWQVENGLLTHKGKSAVDEELFEDHAASAEKIEKRVNKPKKKKLSRNELKAQEVRRRARHLKWLIEGGVKEPDTESD